jgi:hypothetical protein
MITMKIGPYCATIKDGKGTIDIAGVPAVSICEPNTERALTRAYRIMTAANQGLERTSQPTLALTLAKAADAVVSSFIGARYFFDAGV